MSATIPHLPLLALGGLKHSDSATSGGGSYRTARGNENRDAENDNSHQQSHRPHSSQHQHHSPSPYELYCHAQNGSRDTPPVAPIIPPPPPTHTSIALQSQYYQHANTRKYEIDSSMRLSTDGSGSGRRKGNMTHRREEDQGRYHQPMFTSSIPLIIRSDLIGDAASSPSTYFDSTTTLQQIDAQFSTVHSGIFHMHPPLNFTPDRASELTFLEAQYEQEYRAQNDSQIEQEQQRILEKYEEAKRRKMNWRKLEGEIGEEVVAGGKNSKGGSGTSKTASPTKQDTIQEEEEKVQPSSDRAPSSKGIKVLPSASSSTTTTTHPTHKPRQHSTFTSMELSGQLDDTSTIDHDVLPLAFQMNLEQAELERGAAGGGGGKRSSVSGGMGMMMMGLGGGIERKRTSLTSSTTQAATTPPPPLQITPSPPQLSTVASELPSPTASSSRGDASSTFLLPDRTQLDIEQQVLYESFLIRTQATRSVIERFDEYEKKVKGRERRMEEEKRKAREGYLKGVEVEEEKEEVYQHEVDDSDVTSAAAPTQSITIIDSFSSPPPPPALRQLSLLSSSNTYLTSPTSAEAFFQAKPDFGRTVTIVGSPTAATGFAGGNGTVASSPTAALKRTTPGGREFINLRMASLRTSGWGSQSVKAGVKKSSSGGVNTSTNDITGMTMMKSESSPSTSPQSTLRTLIPPTSQQIHSSGSPFARLSQHRQRSGRSASRWNNRIKRHGLGESAGRGSDTRAAVVQGGSLVDREEMLARERYEVEKEQRDENTRLLHEQRRDLEELQQSSLLAFNTALGSVGTPSPMTARSKPVRMDEDADKAEKRMLPPPPRVDGENRGTIAAAATSDQQQQSQSSAIHIPHYMRQIDRSVTRSLRRAVVVNEAAAAAMNGDEIQVSLTHRPGAGGGVRGKSPPKSGSMVTLGKRNSLGAAGDSSSSTSSSSTPTVFPSWLWSRTDFQTLYTSIPFETCLRILHMFPDERTQLHLEKLRMWILERKGKEEGREKEGSSSSSATTTTAANNKLTSTITSHSNSRSNLTPATTITHTLPPLTLDYLCSLPRPILDGVLRIMKVCSYQAGETIWKQGQQGDLFGVVVEGKVMSKRVEVVPTPVTAVAAASTVTMTPYSQPSHHPSGTQHTHHRRPSFSISLSQPPVARVATGQQQHTRASLSQSGLTPPPPPAAHHQRANTASHTSSVAGRRPSIFQNNTRLPPSSPPLTTANSAPMPSQPSQQSQPPQPPPPQHQRIETHQLILPGSAFGHKQLHDIDSITQTQVREKRIAKLWSLVRLHVRKSMRDASESSGVYNQLARLEYETIDATSATESGKKNLRNNKRTVVALALTSNGGNTSSLHSREGLSELKERTETIVAATNCTIFTISFYAFASIEFAYQQEKLNAGITFLSQIPFFKLLEHSRLRHFYSLLLPRTFKRGEVVWKQGTASEEIGFVESGSLLCTREIIVTESHRYPISHTKWRCEETTGLVSSGMASAGTTAAAASAMNSSSNSNSGSSKSNNNVTASSILINEHDYIGEDLYTSTTRDFTLRCRSDTCKIWMLHKRYIHFLTKWSGLMQATGKMRRKYVSEVLTQMMKEKYPAQHAQTPFQPIDWVTARQQALEKNLDPASAPELHYTSSSTSSSGNMLTRIDPYGMKEFLYLPSGAIYVRLDPSHALLKMLTQSSNVMPAANHTTASSSDDHVTNMSTTAGSLLSGISRRNSLTGIRAANVPPLVIPLRPRKICRIFTAPSSATTASSSRSEETEYRACFSMPVDETRNVRRGGGTTTKAAKHAPGHSPAASFSEIVRMASIRQQKYDPATDQEEEENEAAANLK